MNVDQLVSALKGISLGAKSKRKKNRRKKASVPVQVVQVSAPSKKRRKNKKKNSSRLTGATMSGNFATASGSTSCTISKREYTGKVVSTTGDFFQIGVSQMPSLKAFAKVFELYRFTKLVFYYVGTASTTQSGSVVLGVDVNGKYTKQQCNKENVSRLDNAVCVAVWGKATLQVNLKNFNEMKWYATEEVIGSLCWSGGSANGGDIWVEYTCHFAGPRAE